MQDDSIGKAANRAVTVWAWSIGIGWAVAGVAAVVIGYEWWRIIRMIPTLVRP